MSQTGQARTRSAAIRQQLGYPVIDGDGHIAELVRVFGDYVQDHGFGELLQQVPEAAPMLAPELRRPKPELSLEDRRRGGVLPASWHLPAKADYYATIAVPSLYHERLPEAGIDFAVLYPTVGIGLLQLVNDEQRVTLCRLYNEFMAEQYRPYRDRFTVAALIPMHSPDEAIEAMIHATKAGAKVGLIPSHVHRHIPGDRWPADDPFSSARIAEWETHGWVDTYGIDSLHDYDPVWAKAIELKLPLAAHTAGIGFSDRASITNFVYNQIGHFAASGAALAKSLFLGGVTRRFPRLRIALLEGGVAQGVQVYIALVTNWQKRGGKAIRGLSPSNIDRDELARLIMKHDPRLSRYSPEELLWAGGPKEAPDDFAAAKITSVEDIRDLFCTNFFWGCEGDDPLVGIAFDPRITPLGARVPALLGSDLGHWDVPDFDAPLAETYELLEHGILDADAFREFVFLNPLRFYSSLNADFFSGTAVEREAAAALNG
jgi:predicted TIM-barrel fold metal-dependent hydrolase